MDGAPERQAAAVHSSVINVVEMPKKQPLNVGLCFVAFIQNYLAVYRHNPLKHPERVGCSTLTYAWAFACNSLVFVRTDSIEGKPVWGCRFETVAAIVPSAIRVRRWLIAASLSRNRISLIRCQSRAPPAPQLPHRNFLTLSADPMAACVETGVLLMAPLATRLGNWRCGFRAKRTFATTRVER